MSGFQNLECGFYTHECGLHTFECLITLVSVVSLLLRLFFTLVSVFFTVLKLHSKCKNHTQDFFIDCELKIKIQFSGTQSVVLTFMSVFSTLMSVNFFITLISVDLLLCRYILIQ
jgi:hypothetical protein